MFDTIKQDALHIIECSLAAVQPDEAVKRALAGRSFPGRIIPVAVGKAAWRMAKAAADVLGDRLAPGIVITKYGHVMGPIPGMICREAGHPIPDENSFAATREALQLTENLSATDTVLFLLSGGGSALFESPLVSAEILRDMTDQLLACGAGITEINTIRKRLSAVKGGRFALHCSPARVLSVILSDVVGGRTDMIASGPACPDCSTCAEALAAAEKHSLRLTEETKRLLGLETPKELDNVDTIVSGNVRDLCSAAADACRDLGYEPRILTASLTCEAKEAGADLGRKAKALAASGKAAALIAGGETVVKLTGTGKGGRNQELALAAAEEIAGLDNVLVFSLGSDGTDGPTDAAGGMVDGTTRDVLLAQGLTIREVLKDNDSWHALKAVDGLIVTGPTGTNVNDVAVALIRPEELGKPENNSSRNTYR